MEINKSDQSGNCVYGPQAGRDVNLNTHNYNSLNPTAMSRLIERYEEEERSGSKLHEIIRELRHLANPNECDVRGLKEKLETSERRDLINQAMQLKEMAAKELIRAPNTESAQKIYSLVLGNIWSSFTNLVCPLIREGRSRAEVDAAIQKDVIAPAFDLLELNPICLNQRDIMALYYFLAGNCHIAWDIE